MKLPQHRSKQFSWDAIRWFDKSRGLATTMAHQQCLHQEGTLCSTQVTHQVRAKHAVGRVDKTTYGASSEKPTVGRLTDPR